MCSKEPRGETDSSAARRIAAAVLGQPAGLRVWVSGKRKASGLLSSMGKGVLRGGMPRGIQGVGSMPTEGQGQLPHPRLESGTELSVVAPVLQPRAPGSGGVCVISVHSRELTERGAQARLKIRVCRIRFWLAWGQHVAEIISFATWRGCSRGSCP